MKKNILTLLILFFYFSCELNAINMEIHVFIHACTLANWEDILERQLNSIENCGLYEACHSISLGVLGKGDISSFIDRYPKLTILFQHPDMSLYERPTLLALHDRALSHPDAAFLYIHTKGVTKVRNSNVTDWVKYMEYFVIDRWHDCVAALEEDYDLCGVNWRLDPKPHFSGNFWWVSSNYASTLPNEINVQFLSGRHFPHSDYLASEMWVGQNSPKVMCFHESNIDHYNYPYPEIYYK